MRGPEPTWIVVREVVVRRVLQDVSTLTDTDAPGTGGRDKEERQSGSGREAG